MENRTFRERSDLPFRFESGNASAYHGPMRLAVRLLGVVEVVLDGERLRAFDSLRLQRFLGVAIILTL